MKKIILSFFFVCLAASAAFAGGTECTVALDTATCKVTISSATELQKIKDSIASCKTKCGMAVDTVLYVALDADIEFSSQTQDSSCSANWEGTDPLLEGTLDGQGHKISGLCLRAFSSSDAVTSGTNKSAKSLFSDAGGPLVVKNLSLENIYQSITSTIGVSTTSGLLLSSTDYNVDIQNITLKNITVDADTVNKQTPSVYGILVGMIGGNLQTLGITDSMCHFSQIRVSDVHLNAGPMWTSFETWGGLVGEMDSLGLELRNSNVSLDMTFNLGDSANATTNKNVLGAGAIVGVLPAVVIVDDTVAADITISGYSNQDESLNVGIFSGSVSAASKNGVSVKNSIFSGNIIRKARTYGIKDTLRSSDISALGGIFGGVSAKAFSLNNTKVAVNIHSSHNLSGSQIIGGVTGMVKPDTSMVFSVSDVTSSGNISVDSSAMRIFAGGGLFGYAVYSSKTPMSIKNSNVTGDLSLTDVARVDTANGTLYAGGWIGVLVDSSNVLNFRNLSFTGNISADADGQTLTVGGIVGWLTDQSFGTQVSMDSITVTSPLTLSAREIVSGSLFGYVMGVIDFNVRNAETSGTHALISKPEDNTALTNLSVSGENFAGGFIGKAELMRNFRISNSKSESPITFQFQKNDSHVGMTSPTLYLGGLLGYFLTDNTANAAKIIIDSSSYTGTLSALDAENMGLMVGGFVGSAIPSKAALDSIVISSSYAEGLSGSLISVSVTDDNGSYDAAIGGFLGSENANFTGVNLAYSRGSILVNGNVSSVNGVYSVFYVSEFFGEVYGNKFAFENTFRSGAILVTGTSPNGAFIVSGAFHNGIATAANPVVISKCRSNYIYDSTSTAQSFFQSGVSFSEYCRATAFTKNADSLVVIDTVSLAKVIGSKPAFAVALNDSSTGAWYYDPSLQGGFPQLIAFATSARMPTRRIYFKDPNGTYSFTYSKTVAYTDASGLIAYDSAGVGIDIDDLPLGANTGAVSGSQLIWCDTTNYSVWKRDSSVVYASSVSYIPMLIPSVVRFVKASGATGASSNVSVTSDPGLFWDGADYSLFGKDTLPSVVYYSEGTYHISNAWRVPTAAGDTLCRTSACYISARLGKTTNSTNASILDSLVLDTSASEPYNATLEVKDIDSLVLHIPVFSTTLDTTLLAGGSRNLPLRKPFVITAADTNVAKEDSLRIMTARDTLTVAFGDTVALKDYSSSILIMYKSSAPNTIAFSVPDTLGTIFRSAAFPSSYLASQSSVDIPQVASLSACFLGWAASTGDTVYNDGQNNLVQWIPGATHQDVTFTAVFNSCYPDTVHVSVVADSGAALSVFHYSTEVPLTGDSEIIVPRLTGLKLIVFAKPVSTSFSVDSLFFEGSRIANPDTIFVSENETLRVFASYTANGDTTVKDTTNGKNFEIARAESFVSGSVSRIRITPEEIRAVNALRLSVRIYRAKDSSLIVDTTLTENAEEKEYSFVYYPLAPGSYYAKTVLAGKEDSVSRTLSWNIDRPEIYSNPGYRWQMLSLSALDTANPILKDPSVSFYYWDEENPIGEFWQYRELKNIADIRQTAGYWFFADDSIDLPISDVPQKADSDSLVWNLKCRYNCWNLISNPYSWPIYLETSGRFTSAASDKAPFWRWNGESAEYEPTDTIGAYEALWVQVSADTLYSVSSDPVFVGDTASSSYAAKAAAAKTADDGNCWSLRLKLVAEDGSSDSWNVIGSGSKEVSIAEPPAGMGKTVSLSIDGAHGALAKSIRSAGDELSWTLQMKSSGARKAALSIDGLEALASRGYAATLTVDGQTVMCKAGESVPVTLSAYAKTAEFKVSAAADVELASAGLSDLRYAFANGQVFISFSLSESYAGKVATAQIIDAHGKSVSAVRSLTVAGENKLAVRVPQGSGIYFLKVSAGNGGRIVPLKF